MRRLRLHPEYGAGPLWEDDWDGESALAPTSESLGLSAELCEALNTWQAIYDATLNQEYPPDSAFPSERDRLAWEQSGPRSAPAASS